MTSSLLHFRAHSGGNTSRSVVLAIVFWSCIVYVSTFQDQQERTYSAVISQALQGVVDVVGRWGGRRGGVG